jgi:antitoxin StbD
MTTTNILNSIIPVSRFNKGEAGRIFDQLHHDKTQIVVKNNAPVAVLMSPDEYARLIEENEDCILQAEAALRISQSGKNDYISESDFIASVGLSEADLSNYEDVEIE